MTANVVLDTVTKFYLESGDFNGIPLAELLDDVAEAAAMTNDAVMSMLAVLVAEQKVSLVFSDVNPHIKAFADLPQEDQLRRLEQDPIRDVCVYPTEATITGAVDVSEYDARPFTKRLLLGAPQLEPAYFDLHVLDAYASDPRYYYSFWDYAGSISVAGRHYESEDMPERDKVLLQTFGIGYDVDRNRVVVVFLRYLSDLSPEHQRIWQAHSRNDKCKMVYEYYQNSILGDWAEFVSVYQATLDAQRILNELAAAIGKPPLFLRTFTASDRPRGFSSLLRPTLKGYLEFVHLLDKMLSDNLNKDFFVGDVDLQNQVRRKDGKVEVTNKGTITLLDEWLRKVVRFPTEEPYTSIIGPLREVRKLRQQPAHAVVQDEYNMKYIQQQDELVSKVSRGMIGLCFVLSTHPRAKGYVLPNWLLEAKVKSY